MNGIKSEALNIQLNNRTRMYFYDSCGYSELVIKRSTNYKFATKQFYNIHAYIITSDIITKIRIITSQILKKIIHYPN